MALPKIPEGHERAYIKCHHKNVGFYDYVPYSLSSPIAFINKCGCDVKQCTPITRKEFFEVIKKEVKHGRGTVHRK